MKKKVCVLLIFTSLVLGCPSNELQTELKANQLRAENKRVQEEYAWAMFRLGFKLGHNQVLQFYLDHHRFPTSEELDPDAALSEVLKELAKE